MCGCPVLQMATGWALGAVRTVAPEARKAVNPVSETASPYRKKRAGVSNVGQKTLLAQIYPPGRSYRECSVPGSTQLNPPRRAGEQSRSFPVPLG